MISKGTCGFDDAEEGIGAAALAIIAMGAIPAFIIGVLVGALLF